MKVYTVTTEWEDEREGQWIQTLAVLSNNLEQAESFARAYIADSRVEREENISISHSGEWVGYAQPRVIATLEEDRTTGEPIWREHPSGRRVR